MPKLDCPEIFDAQRGDIFRPTVVLGISKKGGKYRKSSFFNRATMEVMQMTLLLLLYYATHPLLLLVHLLAPTSSRVQLLVPAHNAVLGVIQAWAAC